jgi:LPXTG-motif cell wall-anchored protein
MRKFLALMAVIVSSAANAYAGRPVPVQVTNIPTLNEWGTVGAVVVLGLVGVFFLVRRRKSSCCS